MKKLMLNILFTGIAIVTIILDGFFTFIKPFTKNDLIPTDTTSRGRGGGSQREPNMTYRDGTYTGTVVPTRWGDIQVQISVAEGKFTTVNILKYPTDDKRSASIKKKAIPTYTKEAVDSQSADIQLISGATDAYEGFTGSLQDALNQAEEVSDAQ